MPPERTRWGETGVSLLWWRQARRMVRFKEINATSFMTRPIEMAVGDMGWASSDGWASKTCCTTTRGVRGSEGRELKLGSGMNQDEDALALSGVGISVGCVGWWS